MKVCRLNVTHYVATGKEIQGYMTDSELLDLAFSPFFYTAGRKTISLSSKLLEKKYRVFN
jgi:hypothetical protein